MAAGDFDDLAGQHSRLAAGEKQDGFRNVLRLDQLTHGNQRNNYLFKFVIDPSGLGRTGCNTIDGDPILRHFQSNAAGQRLQGRLAGTIGDLPGKTWAASVERLMILP